MNEEEAREIIRLLVAGADAGIYETPYGSMLCMYCFSSDYDYPDMHHEPDCPITKGRECLAKLDARIV